MSLIDHLQSTERYIPLTEYAPLPKSVEQQLIEFHKQQHVWPPKNLPDATQEEIPKNSIGLGTIDFLYRYGSCHLLTYHRVDDDLQKIVKDNMPGELAERVTEIGLLEMLGNRMIPHIDCQTDKKYHLNYLLVSGGDNVKTTWYKPKPEFEHLEIVPSAIPLDRVESICEYTIPPSQWSLLSVNEIHGVENIENFFRLQLSMGLRQ